MYAVVVTFKIDPSAAAAFEPLMRANAATSLADEPLCHRFDVCTDPARPGEVFLYELYADAAAFQVHLDSPHFQAFDAATRDMILDKDVRTYAQVAP
ncbi:MAG: putative quinol monooxygenase [Pseudomonadota bacterium]